MFEPLRLKRWTLPDSYFGEVWPEYYVVYGQHRDSDSLTRSNFQCIQKALGENAVVVCESHWAVGWIEWIGVHQDFEETLKVADELVQGLDDYPVINEEHWSELEYTEVHDYWASMSLQHRMDYCRDANVSVFAARRTNEIPDEVYEVLR